MIKDYIKLTKPGIVRGNIIVAFAGFMLAANGNINFYKLISTIFCLSLIISSACVFNNVIDIDIDKIMHRTKNRALITGKISKKNALIFAYLLIIVGVVIMFLTVNTLAAIISIFGFFSYVIIYGYFKRNSPYSTEIGSISGATPPVIGYVAVTNRLDLAAGILFIILVLWQMPHFYAIGIKRVKEYKSAKIPLISVKYGIDFTKKKSILYIVILLFVTPLLTLFNYTGWTYLVLMVFVVSFWLSGALVDFNKTNDKIWSTNMFKISLVVLLTFSILLIFNTWLP